MRDLVGDPQQERAVARHKAHGERLGTPHHHRHRPLPLPLCPHRDPCPLRPPLPLSLWDQSGRIPAPRLDSGGNAGAASPRKPPLSPAPAGQRLLSEVPAPSRFRGGDGA